MIGLLLMALALVLLGCQRTPETGQEAQEGVPQETEPAREATPGTPVGQPPMPGGLVTVTLTDSVFDPATITVQPGQTVRWVNQGTTEHTVTSGVRGNPTGLFNERLQPGGTFEHTFDQAGSFQYFCEDHAGMEGTVEVRQGGGM